MPKHFLFLLPLAVALLCGCNKQAKINAAKLDALAQRVAALQQAQSNQLAEMRAQLAAVAPTLDRINGNYFEKSHEDAFFYHTNTLYLLLLVDQKIESELQLAAAERAAEHSLAAAWHTNELDALNLAVAQVKDDTAARIIKLQAQLEAEIQKASAALAAQLQAAQPDAAELARRQQLAADVAQIKSALEPLKARLAVTNAPAARP